MIRNENTYIRVVFLFTADNFLHDVFALLDLVDFLRHKQHVLLNRH